MRPSIPIPPIYPDAPEPQRIVYPSWMDPAYMLRTSAAVWSSEFTIPAGLTATIPANPRRWALGVYLSRASMASTLRVSSFQDAEHYYDVELGNTNAPLSVWYKTWNVGPRVQYEWYLWGSTGAFWRFVEVELY